MRHRNKKKILDRKRGPRQALFRNLAMQILLYERVKTTEAKAKAVRPLLERLIERSKQNSLTNRRYLLSSLPTKKVVDKCLEVVGPRYVSRKGGYTRVVPVGIRKGDGAREVMIELV